MSQLGKQTTAINILPNISISKGNQKMKLDQLIEYNMKIIFLEKSYTKGGGKTIPRPFSKKLKVTLSPGQQSTGLYSLFQLYAKLRAIKEY